MDMKYDCDVIKDLLPLYEDGVASEKSKSIVEEHFSECSSCKNYFSIIRHATEQSGIMPETAETANYKKLAKRLRLRKVLIYIGIILILSITALIAYGYVQGIRFDAQQTANINRYVDEKSVLLGEVEINSYKVFFYENEDKYRTIITEKAYFVWKNGNSFWANKNDDKVKLVGWCSMTGTESGKGVTAIPVQSYDKQVAYIEMGPEGDRLIKDVAYGKTSIFAWDKAIRWNDLNAIAYSSSNKPLYKLGYEIVNNHINTDELRWLPIE
jgi:hypothetical protein